MLTHPGATGFAGENSGGSAVPLCELYALWRWGQEDMPLDPSGLPLYKDETGKM